MTNVLPFKRTKKTLQKSHILCKRGFHKWTVIKDQQFDVKQGKLVTVSQCERCGLTKNEAR